MKNLVKFIHPDIEKSKVNRLWIKELEAHNGITINNVYSNYPDWN